LETITMTAHFVSPVAVGWTLALLCAAYATCRGDEAVSFVEELDSLTITIGGQPFGKYRWNDEQVRRPYFENLRAPGGLQVTRNNPPREGDAADHATMHPGLWLAFGDISGHDFWRNKAEVKHVGFSERPKTEGNRGGFAALNRYRSGEAVICDETCRIRIVARPASTLIVWDSQFTGPDDFTFGDQEEMGLGVRVATPLAVKNGGQIVNSDGLLNEKQLWGKPADWCEYHGTIGGKAVGILLAPDPKNFRRSWFHARDYGVLVANPFGENAFTKGPKSRITIKDGEILRIRFGILLHSGETDLKAAYADCLHALE
jgi:hypothetical protein